MVNNSNNTNTTNQHPPFFRFFIKKKPSHDQRSKLIKKEITRILGGQKIKKVSLIQIYDLKGFDYFSANKLCQLVLKDSTQDEAIEKPNIKEPSFITEFLPGKYDQTAHAVKQLAQLIFGFTSYEIKTSLLYLLEGQVSDKDMSLVKSYYINPLEVRTKDLTKNPFITINPVKPSEEIIDLNQDLSKIKENLKLSMSLESLSLTKEYFLDIEKRSPSKLTLKFLDAYWSDHCRHITFASKISKISFSSANTDFSAKVKTKLTDIITEFTKDSKHISKENGDKPLTLMDLATTATKVLHQAGDIPNLDQSPENNACSFKVELDIEGKKVPWLIMFKNETHNHPTEIEPFSGAQTCVGGVVRDPLSGRSYVYQAIRVSGGANPNEHINKTLKGKLPLIKLIRDSARGFSSYGNQIGLATSLVREVFHQGYRAKRLECGLTVGAAPEANIIRISPAIGDAIIIVGGKTGNDGVGGAAGSSKLQKKDATQNLTSEVQRGDPIAERKIQRLFKIKEVSQIIKKCNDCGAGGVSVAAAELADGVQIELADLPTKYDGLTDYELALSESQERMLVVVEQKNVQLFLKQAQKENLIAVSIGSITGKKKLEINWKGQNRISLANNFLASGGFIGEVNATIKLPKRHPLKENINSSSNILKYWVNQLSKIETASQQSLGEMFDFSIGKSTVLAPYGGKYQLTPCEASVVKIDSKSDQATAVSFGFDAHLSDKSPFHGGAWAVIDSLAKLVALGANRKRVYLTFQEYFEKLTNEISWGKPLAALLGAYWAQKAFKIAAIGGKDSMSGTYYDIKVPPTLISFAVSVVSSELVVSPEFKRSGSNLYLFESPLSEEGLPEPTALKKGFDLIHKLIKKGKILSAQALAGKSLATTISQQSFGNKIGVELDLGVVEFQNLFRPRYGAIVIEVSHKLTEINFEKIGTTQASPFIKVAKEGLLLLDDLIQAWQKPFLKIFPKPINSRLNFADVKPANIQSHSDILPVYKPVKIAKPRVLILVFPGTNSEYDTSRAFEKAGAVVQELVFINLSQADLNQSIQNIVTELAKSQILVIPGGFSLADEPAGAGKFIATLFLNPKIKEAITKFLQEDKLILGICNGFQALIKSGLLPYGKIQKPTMAEPTLSFNLSARHVAKIVTTKIISTTSPWYKGAKGNYNVAISHSEGRFAMTKKTATILLKNKQIAEAYIDNQGKYATEYPFNPNGSDLSVEAITSKCGKILGKMGHAERAGQHIFKNITGKYSLFIFKNGVDYFS
ncbi:MAG: phosphoribosylformylglycinamidine synthase [SAR324 cluster bacterium]|nr:phosphoribosylformylglycinamidine synthase [SAR324 cluster bacterium]